MYVRFGLVDRPTYEYIISGILLQKAVSTKDLGIIFDSKLSFSDHCHAVASKGFARVNSLLRSFHSRDRDLQIKLFNCYVRPILEFNSPIWSSHLKYDRVVFERVQKFFTKILRGLKHYSHAQRLFILKQPSLELRRIRYDLITLHKILHGLVDLSLKNLFVLASDVSTCCHTLRGHVFELFLPKPRSDMLKNSFYLSGYKSLELSPTNCVRSWYFIYI